MNPELLSKVKSRGHWRVVFRPVTFEQERFSLSRCKTLIEESMVELRGWPYPYVPRPGHHEDRVEPHESFVQGWCDWGTHKQVWRQFQSGQFVHLCGLREDWFSEESGHDVLAKKHPPGASLGVVGSVVWEVTEMFELLARLAQAGHYDEGADVSVRLHNSKGRALWMDASSRAPLHFDYMTEAQTVGRELLISRKEIEGRREDLVVEFLLRFFGHFFWDRCTRGVLIEMRDQLLNRRY